MLTKEELIELNGKEYTATLNRESYIRIDKYTNMQNSFQTITSNLYEYVDEIEDGINPFVDDLDIEKLDEELEKREEILKEMYVRAFWIWLYPVHKLDKSEVKEILNSYINGTDEDFDFISKKYSEFLKKSIEIRDKYNQERKNLKAQANKK